MVTAAYLPKEVVNQTQKAVLMKIADSADDQTRVGRPGLERMMAWAGVGEKQVIAVVTELVGLGLLERAEVGRVGRRAEYRIFPFGVPPIPSTEELIARRAAAKAAPKNPRLARKKKPSRRRPSPAARTHEDVAARKEQRSREEAAKEGGFPQGNPPGGEERVPSGEPSGLPDGNPKGSPGGTPSLPSSSSFLPYPPTPTDGAAGEPGTGEAEPPAAPAMAGCPKHPSPARNCRGCGTNPRAEREQQRRDEAEQDHSAQQEWLREFFEAQQRRLADSDPATLEAARKRTRELARIGRTQGANARTSQRS